MLALGIAEQLFKGNNIVPRRLIQMDRQVVVNTHLSATYHVELKPFN